MNTHTSNTSELHIMLYDMFMGAIEPELCTDILPALDVLYVHETDEERVIRMERYAVSIENFKMRAAEFSHDFEHLIWQIGDQAMHLAKEHSKNADAVQLQSTEDSIEHS